MRAWDSADRRTPYTDEITLGYERQLAANLAVSADYVHASNGDLLMLLDLNPGLRATTAATSPLVRQSSDTLNAAYAELRQTYPGFANFTTAVTQPVNVAELGYDALLLSVNKRFGHNYETRVSYTLSKSRGNTTGNGVPTSGFQVLDDLNLDLNEGPVELRHAAQLRGQRPGGDPEDRRPQRELGGARPERRAVHADQQHRRSRSQRDVRRAAARRHVYGERPERLHGRGRGGAKRRLRSRVRQPRLRDQLRVPARPAPPRGRSATCST